MKLLVVSDSHGERSILKKLHDRYVSEVDAMIHCGDSELHAVDPVLKGYTVVKGNCDVDNQFQEEVVQKVSGSTVFVAHGHLHQVNSSLLNLSYRAKENAADFVFFGHTHLLGAEIIDGILYLNPGSISYPRGGNPRTYAIIEKTDIAITVYFYNEQYIEIETLRQTFHF